MQRNSLVESIKALSKPQVRILTSLALLFAMTVPTVLIAQTARPSAGNDENLSQARKNGTDQPQKQDPDNASFIAPDSGLAPEGSPCGWTAAAVSPLPILDQATTTVGSNLYTFAGVSTNIIATSQKFDGTSWSSIASVPVALEFPSAVSDGTSAYIINGVNGSGASVNTLYRYNPGSNTYDTLAPSTTATWNQASVYLNGKIYKIGGYISSGGTTTSSNALEIYNIATNTWSPGAPYPVAQGWMSAYTDGTYVYVAGGLAAETGAVPSVKTYRYDPATNTWDDAAIADLPNSRWGAASSVTTYNGGWVLAGGYVDGTAAANLSATVTQWNPGTNSWSALPSMLSARSRMTGAVLNGAFHVIGGRSSAGGFGGTNDNQRLFCIPQNQPFLTSSVAYVSDNGTPANGVPDPGETVTVSLTIQNIGGAATGNVVATLAASGGITNPSGPVTFGVINPGQTVTQNFTFVVPAAAQCGSQITLTFDIADGATHYSATKSFNLGVLQVAFQQNFDGVTVPALPAGWVQNQTSGTGITWTTVNTLSSSSPNSAFAADPAAINATALESPAFNVTAANYILTFKNRYATESTFDGMVLEIKIGSGAWTDFVTAGGAFTAGGYNATISTAWQSPIAGRQAWSGSSNGFITTTGTFPASAVGQSVQLRWLMASDQSVASTGVNIDDVQVTGGYACNTTTTVRSRADFDGDGKTDLSVFRPSEGNWYVNGSTAGFSALHWGATGDVVVPGDYDGDNKADYAVFRPNDNPAATDFYILRSNGFTMAGYSWGVTNDIPVAGDFDGDGKSDITVFRPSTGTWYISGSLNGARTVALGANGDIPLAIDRDGDGKAEPAVFRPSNSTWSITTTTGVETFQFGATGDIAVPADYDGDNKDDIAVFRPSNGTWYIAKSSGGVSFIQFGASGDVPVPGDYDGDGKDDVAVYRNGVWYMSRSTAGFAASSFGLSNDKPIPAAYRP